MAKNSRTIIGVIFLSMISSCVFPKTDPCLSGQIYLNDQTQDRMEFTKEGTVIITWSDVNVPHVYPHEYSYSVYDGGRKLTVLYLASTTIQFPYKVIEISDSKDKITVTRTDGRKELFIRISRP